MKEIEINPLEFWQCEKLLYTCVTVVYLPAEDGNEFYNITYTFYDDRMTVQYLKNYNELLRLQTIFY